jgi:hypothetical protein
MKLLREAGIVRVKRKGHGHAANVYQLVSTRRLDLERARRVFTSGRESNVEDV